jgi:ABC-type nitrate/sulfonate/bicarbonate transport system permease component
LIPALLQSPSPSPSPHITWVKIERPVFDLVGVVLSSLGIAAVCVLVALGLGIILGVGIILRRRRRPPISWTDNSLHLLEARRP